jgi:hypothetical protein
MAPGYHNLLEYQTKIFSWIFFILYIISTIVLAIGLNTITNGIRDDNLIQIGLIGYFVSLIGYFVARFMYYERKKLELRKKIEVHRVGLPVSGEYKFNDSRSESLDSSSLRSSSFVRAQGNFDSKFRYKRRVKYLTPIFTHIDSTPFNFIQSGIILTEFMQVVSFPIRDLFRSFTFLQSLQSDGGQNTLKFIEFIRNLFTVFSTGTSSVNFNYLKFIFCWWIAVFFFVVASVLFSLQYLLHDQRVIDVLPRKFRLSLSKSITGPWIVSVLPLVNVSYLIFLNAFLEPLGCLSSNSTPIWPASFEEYVLAQGRRQQECYAIHDIRPGLHTAYCIFGFTISFFLFTICR